MLTIQNLYLYPIKSLGAVSVTEAIVEEKGFRYDRRYMLVDPTGQFITQRSNHHMALIDVAIADTTLRVWHRARPENALELPVTAPEPTGLMPVNIWDSHGVQAVTVSDAADRWFSEALGLPCRLVYMPETTRRPIDTDYAQNDEAVSFADGYPYLFIGQASLNHLNQQLDEPLSMARFRPSIVVSGSGPNEEDTWAHIRIGDVDFYGVKPCARCVLTTIDPATGEKGKEPLKTLATYRQWKHKILFGQNVLVSPGTTGTVRVGQSINVVSRQEPWLSPPVPVPPVL
ncbi:MOSC domain-containing protein [Fibrisoma montanum]|uniref:MOSC domain-containing protein n=1 Tax=Fibrisoma montanum TaxID=2305895 RepID=A0A418MHE4_9BACT|nr:MOSC N-terminal beta barrel domain-containing protein [Fibrisoma montanum]RIV26858.1 MOSC domain-containing protein [Fibrisoma montanum]